MPRPRKDRLRWKRSRAYADFRDYAPWEGRIEALIPEGATGATTDEDTARILIGRRLEALQALKQKHPQGLPAHQVDPLDRFAPFAAYHLARRAEAPQGKRVTEKWLAQHRIALKSAARYFAGQGRTTLRAIEPDDVRSWLEDLRTNPPNPARPLSDATRRKYMDALGNLFRRARRENRVDANPVSDLLSEEKPTGGPSETILLEIPDAVLYLEACRRWTPDGDAGAIPYLYELVATYLITGGRKSEVTGLLIEDVDFDRDVVHFRPNAIRASLKTLKKSRTVVRAVPLHPQLRDILRAYLAGPHAPAGPLLFPGHEGPDRMLTDFRKALDAAARLAGFPSGMMGTRVFRVTWVSARLQCLDHGAPISPFTVAREAGHGSLKMVQDVYGRLGRIRQRREHVEYRWEEWEAQLGDRLGAYTQPLAARWRQALAALPARGGATAKEWQVASGLAVGSYYYARDALLERALVERRGEGRGARFRRTPLGDRALAALSG